MYLFINVILFLEVLYTIVYYINKMSILSTLYNCYGRRVGQRCQVENREIPPLTSC